MASTNTILIDCNQQDSIEAEAGNTTSNAIWTNKVSEGLNQRRERAGARV